jgi:inner membrane protein
LPTVFTHAIAGCVAAGMLGERERPVRVWTAAVAVSVLPDADVIGFAYGVRYSDFLGHRGFFHSPFFALLLAILCVHLLFRDRRPMSRGWWAYVAVFFVAGASHGLLDAMTDGGLGIALLIPFDSGRFFFPWTPIPVAPIGLRAFLGEWGLRILVWEAVYMWAPLLALLAGVLVVRRRARSLHPVDDAEVASHDRS